MVACPRDNAFRHAVHIRSAWVIGSESGYGLSVSPGQKTHVSEERTTMLMELSVGTLWAHSGHALGVLCALGGTQSGHALLAHIGHATQTSCA